MIPTSKTLIWSDRSRAAIVPEPVGLAEAYLRSRRLAATAVPSPCQPSYWPFYRSGNRQYSPLNRLPPGQVPLLSFRMALCFVPGSGTQ
jgi:hypothetical protein